MHKSTITIEVETDEQKIPAGISWSATDTGAENDYFGHEAAPLDVIVDFGIVMSSNAVLRS